MLGMGVRRLTRKTPRDMASGGVVVLAAERLQPVSWRARTYANTNALQFWVDARKIFIRSWMMWRRTHAATSRWISSNIFFVSSCFSSRWRNESKVVASGTDS